MSEVEGEGGKKGGGVREGEGRGDNYEPNLRVQRSGYTSPYQLLHVG